MRNVFQKQICRRSLRIISASAPLFFFLFTFVLEGCAPGPHLKPAPEARRVAGVKKAAVVDAFGVRIIARGDAWSGNPTILRQILTPIQVTLENRSGRPIQIGYNHFALVGAAGLHAVALPPQKIETPARVPAIAPPAVPAFSHQRFLVAPYDSPFLGTYLVPWSNPFAFDPVYYQQYYALQPIRLPTPEMLRKAIPEGVLDDNGRLSGFLYFQPIGKENSRVTFNAELVDADTGERLGAASIPFLVE